MTCWTTAPPGTSGSHCPLRADTFSMNLMERLQRVRKGGLTSRRRRGPAAAGRHQQEPAGGGPAPILPHRFRRRVERREALLHAGPATETDEDVLGIADLARKVYFAWRECSPNKARGVRITVSTSWFVPKPHTAFQWDAQIPREEYQRRVNLLRDALKRDRSITYNWHDPRDQLSGGRVLPWRPPSGRRAGGGPGQHGAKFDSWSEYFDFQRWMDA